jgi:hypothetical protein
MAIKYEYNSQCCNHFYVETRNDGGAQISTKCNICGQGDYVETNCIEIESIAAPVYQASDQIVTSAKDKFLAAGFTLEEIEELVQETTNKDTESS